MSPLSAVRHRLQEIITLATTAAEALDAVRDRLADVCERLAVGVDPQGGDRRG
jgi:hypothetical protein